MREKIDIFILRAVNLINIVVAYDACNASYVASTCILIIFFFQTFYQVFEGNKDSNSISKQILPVPVEATYVRIFPLQYEGWMCMRVELYGRGTKCNKVMSFI